MWEKNCKMEYERERERRLKISHLSFDLSNVVNNPSATTTQKVTMSWHRFSICWVTCKAKHSVGKHKRSACSYNLALPTITNHNQALPSFVPLTYCHNSTRAIRKARLVFQKWPNFPKTFLRPFLRPFKSFNLDFFQTTAFGSRRPY